MSPFSLDEIERYQRQILVPEWGAEGQERIRAARLVVRGVGVAAEFALLYLAAAGVGTLETEAFADEVSARNPHVTVRPLRPVEGAPRQAAASIAVGSELLLGEIDTRAAGAALALEALKALLGLPHRLVISRTDVEFPS